MVEPTPGPRPAGKEPPGPFIRPRCGWLPSSPSAPNGAPLKPCPDTTTSPAGKKAFNAGIQAQNFTLGATAAPGSVLK
jgi:hypothetical protein